MEMMADFTAFQHAVTLNTCKYDINFEKDKSRHQGIDRIIEKCAPGVSKWSNILLRGPTDLVRTNLVKYEIDSKPNETRRPALQGTY